MNNVHHASISKIVEQIRGKQISPVELIEWQLARIANLQPKLNAFVHVDAESAKRRAREAESAIVSGEPVGPLHGVPLSIKSCIDVAGWPSPAGSLLRANEIPSHSAPM